MSNLTTDDVDIAVAYPNVGGQAASILCCTVVEHGRYVSSPQHKLCGEPLLEAHSAPRHSRSGCDDRPPNTSHFIYTCFERKLRPTYRTCRQTSDMTEGQHGYGEPCNCQVEERFH